MKKEITEAQMLHKMAAWCSAAEHCIQEVEKKISTAGLSTAASDRIIAHLLKEKFIDEERFCRSFINDKLRYNKWGKQKIRYELRGRGISSQQCTEALNEINEEEYACILTTLLADKMKTIQSDNSYQDIQKLLRYATGKGFSIEESLRCLRKITKDPIDDALIDTLE